MQTRNKKITKQIKTKRNKTNKKNKSNHMNTILPPPIANFNLQPHSNNINQQLLSCNKIQNVNYPAQSTSSNTLIASSSFTSNDYSSTLHSWIRQLTNYILILSQINDYQLLYLTHPLPLVIFTSIKIPHLSTIISPHF